MKTYKVYWLDDGHRNTVFSANHKEEAYTKAIDFLAFFYHYTGDFCIEEIKREDQ